MRRSSDPSSALPKALPATCAQDTAIRTKTQSVRQASAAAALLTLGRPPNDPHSIALADMGTLGQEAHQARAIGLPAQEAATLACLDALGRPVGLSGAAVRHNLPGERLAHSEAR